MANENQHQQQMDPSFFYNIIGQKEVQISALSQEYVTVVQENQGLKERLQKAEELLQKQNKKPNQNKKGGKR
ncbi:hypothetical protein [Rossellomorea marisflavi]|uniref:hypothetical protein n=1 Tax=Rossellomorea marisflavi TaxID=189381 RepID=UPI003D2F46B8